MPHRRACDLTVVDRADIIRQSELAAGLNEAMVGKLAATSTAIDFRRRRFVYRDGDVSDALYLIARGRVKLCRSEPETGREAVIDILPTGTLRPT